MTIDIEEMVSMMSAKDCLEKVNGYAETLLSGGKIECEIARYNGDEKIASVTHVYTMRHVADYFAECVTEDIVKLLHNGDASKAKHLALRCTQLVAFDALDMGDRYVDLDDLIACAN